MLWRRDPTFKASGKPGAFGFIEATLSILPGVAVAIGFLLFGPMVSIVRVGTDEEALAVANDTEYGLSSAVFSRDIPRAMRIASRIGSGMCHINGPTVHDEAQMPFGGTKSSGYGWFGGQAGMAEFTELRWITIGTGPGHYPF